jgi:sigma-B regulation protein RsbU (phosphoserine phosphatase)
MKLFSLVGLPIVAIFIVLIAIEYGSLRTIASDQATERARLLAERTAHDLDAELAGAAAAVDVMAAAMSHGDLDVHRLPDIARQMVQRLPLVEGVVFAFQVDAAMEDVPLAGYVFHRDGQYTFKDIADSFDIVDSPWYVTDAMPGEGVWTEPFNGEVFGGFLVSYSSPFATDTGVRGFVVVDVPLAPLFQQLGVQGYDHVESYLISAGGRFLVHPDQARVMSRGDGQMSKVSASTHVFEQAMVAEPGWTFIAAIGADEVFADVNKQLLLNALLLAAGGLVVLLVLLLTGLRLTQRIRVVAIGVQAVASGNLDAKVVEHGRDEIGALAEGFNRMTSQLRETVQHAAEERAKFAVVERELEVGREIQQTMLPRNFPAFPERAELDLYAILEPTSHVAGDFYDFWLHDDCLSVVVADVSGHGVPAALVMAMSRTVLRDAHASGLDMIGMFQQLNQAVAADNSRQMFVTAVMVQLDLQSGAYRLINGGHPQVIKVSQRRVEPEGMPTGPLLGVMDDAQWTIRDGVLGPGDALVLYTDGITEAMNDAGDLLGTTGLMAKLNVASAQSLCTQAVDAATSFQEGPINDDLTVLCVKWGGNGHIV